MLLLSLLLGAWLAALHPIVHLRPDAGHAHEAGSLKKLLGAHEGADCLVFDHQFHGDGLPVQAMALPAVAPVPAPVACRPSRSGLLQALAFRARAPPSSRLS